MKILVLNCGSSSIKYALYNMDDKSVMTSGGAERVGLDGAFVKVKLANGEKKQIMHDIPEHTEGVKFIFSLLTDPEIGVIKSLDEIDAVGHRMVHGGEKFNKSVILTDEVLKTFEECSDLAPLHNPANLKGVNAVKELMPGLPQVGVFDTAFHQKVCSIRPSIRPCLPRLICMPSLTSFMRSMASVVMDSMAPLTVMCQPVLASSSASLLREPRW